jgi:pyruvate/2-oxoglutarate dehydrogenase complex dihydrolipoamide acyltransferase (E2) component
MQANSWRAFLPEITMQEIRIDEALWATSMLPEGIVVRWLVPDGAIVGAGKPIAEVRVEDALHEILAPASGRVTIVTASNNVVEPGTLLATLA